MFACFLINCQIIKTGNTHQYQRFMNQKNFYKDYHDEASDPRAIMLLLLSTESFKLPTREIKQATNSSVER